MQNSPLLKAPFPYFGGKSRCADDVWRIFGDCRNYVEPFAGSLAVLLARPSPFSGVETVNDYDCHVVNAWRAISSAPELLAALLIAPVAEVNTEAQNFAIVSAERALRDRLGDPAFFDLQLAAYWIKGANEWIGGEWGKAKGPWQWSRENGWQKAGKGINRKLPHLGDAGEFEQRHEFVLRWLMALRDRLCSVRIACGDWRRVLGPSVTTKHAGITAVFLDPPYDGTEGVYAQSQPVSAAVRQWCAENGADPKLRIILCGRGDEHDELLSLGWTSQTWTALKGYAKHEERKTETLWTNVKGGARV